MRNSHSLLAAVLTATFARSSAAQDSTTSRPTDFQLRSSASISVIQTRPQGALGNHIGLGYGLNGAYLYRLDAVGIWSIRADVGVVEYGNESNRSAFSESVGGRVQVKVRTTNYIVPVSVGPQLTWPTGRIRPYVNAGVGGQAFFTESSVDGIDDRTLIASATNQSDFAMTWVAGGGIYVPMLEGKTRVLIDVGVQYLNGGNARYLAPGSIIDLLGGKVRVSSLESSTHIIMLRVGARIGL